jgi:hypothetical protein
MQEMRLCKVASFARGTETRSVPSSLSFARDCRRDTGSLCQRFQELELERMDIGAGVGSAKKHAERKKPRIAGILK